MSGNGDNNDTNNPKENSNSSAILEKIYNRYTPAVNTKGVPTKEHWKGIGTSTPDPSDSFSNDIFLDFYHVASQNSVNFKAFMTNYNETYDVNVNSTPVYGRADPIRTYQNTQRTISIAWKIPARNAEEAMDNVNRLATLIKFLYPAYKPIPMEGKDAGYFSSATTLSKPPLVRVKYANIISNNITKQGFYAKTSGLLGFITNLNHSYDMEGGGFTSVPGGGGPMLFPKFIDVTVNFQPIHEHPIGWASDDNKWIGTDSKKHKIYDKNQGPADLPAHDEQALPSFPFGIDSTMLGLGSADVEQHKAEEPKGNGNATGADATVGKTEPLEDEILDVIGKEKR